MKKILYMVILIFAALLFIVGCNNTKIIDTFDNYILFPSPITLLKININTGNSTPLCTDPFCHHDNNKCVFRDIGSIGVIENTIFYCKRGNESFSYTLNSYNLTTNKNVILYEHFDILDRIYIADSFVYFWATYSNDADNKKVSREYHLQRYDIKKDKIEILTNKAIKYLDFGLAYENGRLFWDSSDDLSGTGVYSTDLNYTNRKEEKYLGVYYKDFVYKSMQNPSSEIINSRHLIRINIKTTEEEFIGENIFRFLIINDKIYYLSLDENPEFVCTSNNVDYYNRYSGKIYSMNLDGTDKKLICDASEYNFVSFLNFASYKAVAGDYIGIDLYDYKDPADLDSYGMSSNIFLFNTKTYEYKIAKYP